LVQDAGLTAQAGVLTKDAAFAAFFLTRAAIREPRFSRNMNYWLFKSEPSTYGIDHLATDKVTAWTGVRNYQARNFMRDQMKAGDRGFFYHSSCAEPGIVGIVEVARAAYPDATQFNRKSRYYDGGATADNPRWFNVDLKFVRKTRLVPIPELRSHKALAKMLVLQRGSRLSITPVTAGEWECVLRLVEMK
jgi:predicted RNA-binding protein with PUA-like domain